MTNFKAVNLLMSFTVSKKGHCVLWKKEWTIILEISGNPLKILVGVQKLLDIMTLCHRWKSKSKLFSRIYLYNSTTWKQKKMCFLIWMHLKPSFCETQKQYDAMDNCCSGKMAWILNEHFKWTGYTFWPFRDLYWC